MDLTSLARNPVPSGAVVGACAGYDGAPLRYARWEPTRAPRRGTVCLFQGRAEFIEKYFETIADLRRRGFAVATFDWRGQGRSFRALPDRRKSHIEDFAEYDKDLVRFMRDVVLPDCPPPYIALAHSMGGNILLRAAAQRGSWFSHMVMSAPMVQIADAKLGMPQGLALRLSEMASMSGMSRTFVPGGASQPAELGDFSGNQLTSDPERFARTKAVLEAAPDLALGAPTVGWLKSAMRSCARLTAPDFASTVEVPVLMLAAGEDTIVSTRAIEELGVKLKLGSHLLLPGSLHEILQETDAIRQRFWAAFDAYLEGAVAAA
ncbi:MAG: alpha/beta hydrolase [Hyphomicrobiaceae bacterium]|nr:alpha/beta hydrolase [Hyphomicrobiaceae bacterium]MCC0010407.1 alpha/beta hydrolase [Hyphomicrobiaceae bacterium]